MMPALTHFIPNMGDHSLATTANTIAYIVSFIFNFIASTRYTFKVKANAKRGAGFTLFSQETRFRSLAEKAAFP